MTEDPRSLADHALRAVDAELRQVRGSLREVILLAVVGGVALILASIGILVVAMGAHQALTPVHGAMQAGLMVGGWLVGVAAVAVLIVIAGVSMHRRRRRLERQLARRALLSDVEMLRNLAGLVGKDGAFPVVPLIALAAGVAVAFFGKRKD